MSKSNAIGIDKQQQAERDLHYIVEAKKNHERQEPDGCRESASQEDVG